MSPHIRLTPMPSARLDEWRAGRSGTREAVPDPVEGEQQEALLVVRDGHEIGRVLLGRVEVDGTVTCVVRTLESSISSADTEGWAEALNAIGERARLSEADVAGGGAETVVFLPRPT